jgi:aminomethyltransferase
MQGIYVIFCNEDGSLKDDAILHKYSDDDYLLLPSDIDHSATFEKLLLRFDITNATITDCTHSWVGIALQGPLSAGVMSHMGFDGVEQLSPFEIKDFSIAGGVVRVARMGFTADLGYECWFEPALRGTIEQCLLEVRETLNLEIPGYGLTALDACRLEGGYIVAGWDCATEADPEPGFERSPFELGLAWLVNLDAVNFVGREALLEQQRSGSRFSLSSFSMNDRRKPDDGAVLKAFVDGREQPVGSINCSAWSQTLGRMIGNASIKSRHTGIKSAWTELDGETVPVRLVKSPLLKIERARQVPAPLQIVPLDKL